MAPGRVRSAPSRLSAVARFWQVNEARDKRERREKALEERNRAVDEQRRERERDVKRAEARLREGEREVEVAMRVGRDGLRSQLEE